MARSLTAALVLALISPLWGEQIGVSEFKYLNNNDNSMTIEQGQAQDLLNVDIRPGGKSVKKRDGYGLYKDLATDQGVHGGHHFFDSTGNDVQIWGSSTSLWGIVADATPTKLISSGTLNATWDCADTQGSAYCANSSRDAYIKTDGATKSWYTSPLGTMVEITPERAIVAGVSGSPNTLYFSESSVFTNFVVGIAETSPFTEVIASPGSKITHIRYGCGKILWWKDQSFGYLNGSTQFDLENKIVSDTVGTFDNTSAMDPGGNVWFRGQDGHIWKYDCSALTKESIEITPLIQTSGKRTSNYWSQTSQSDFETGASSPSTHISTTLIPGSIIVSSFTTVDLSSTDFMNGTFSNTRVTDTGRVYISTNSNEIAENSFESSFASWTNNLSTWEAASNGVYTFKNCSSFNAYDGTKYAMAANAGTLSASLIDANTGVGITTTTVSWVEGSCGYTDRTISSPSSIGRRLVLKFETTSATKLTSQPFIYNGDTIHFRTASDCVFGTCSTHYFYVDYVTGASSSSITSGTYTSKAFDTGKNGFYAYSSATWVADGFTPYLEVQASSATTGPWSMVVRSSGTSSFANQPKRYVRYLSSFTVTGQLSAASYLDSVLLVIESTGSYVSTVHNSPNITAWDTFSANQTLNDGTLTYYVRASTGSFTVLSSTPQWGTQSNGGTVSYSTGTYFQTRIDFGLTSATQTPTVNDFTFNWYEGSASDQAYSEYFDNAVWFTVPYGVGVSSNNYIFKRDLINDGWTLYSFGAGGFAVQNNRIYFGQVGGDNLFKYGTGTSDNGSAITAYWKSKDFAGSDPFLQNTYDQADSLWKQDSGQTQTVTYTIDTSSVTVFTVNTSSTTNSIINYRKNLPGKLGYTVNWKFGDTSATSNWELLGFRFSFSPQPYRPSR